MRSRGELGVSQIDGAWICGRAPNVLCVLAVLVAVAVPLGFAPSALAAETGQITGEVTNASTGARISGIQVCTNVIGECDTTDDAGEYLIPNVAPGTYTLYFYSRDPLTLNYISRETPGVVAAAGETREVGAALQPGGWISGHVIDAATHAPLENVDVCVRAPGEKHGGRCDTTGPNGEYTVSGLLAGSYDVEFFVEESKATENLNYAMQFYSGKSRRSEAEPVPVTAEETTSEINAAMQPGGSMKRESPSRACNRARSTRRASSIGTPSCRACRSRQLL